MISPLSYTPTQYGCSFCYLLEPAEVDANWPANCLFCPLKDKLTQIQPLHLLEPLECKTHCPPTLPKGLHVMLTVSLSLRLRYQEANTAASNTFGLTFSPLRSRPPKLRLPTLSNPPNAKHIASPRPPPNPDADGWAVAPGGQQGGQQPHAPAVGHRGDRRPGAERVHGGPVQPPVAALPHPGLPVLQDGVPGAGHRWRATERPAAGCTGHI